MRSAVVDETVALSTPGWRSTVRPHSRAYERREPARKRQWQTTRAGPTDPPGSTWGDFGADDERGRLNLLTPAKVLQGIAEVRVGENLLPVAAA